MSGSVAIWSGSGCVGRGPTMKSSDPSNRRGRSTLGIPPSRSRPTPLWRARKRAIASEINNNEGMAEAPSEDMPLPVSSQLLDFIGHPLELVADQAGARIEEITVGCQRRSAGVAGDQRGAQRELQGAQRFRHRGLRQSKCGGRGAQAALVGDREEMLQMVEIER